MCYKAAPPRDMQVAAAQVPEQFPQEQPLPVVAAAAGVLQQVQQVDL